MPKLRPARSGDADLSIHRWELPRIRPWTTTSSMTLSTGQVLYGYAHGVFPMAQQGQIYWYDPDPRAILPLDAFHVPRRLARTVRQGALRITVNREFERVIRACAVGSDTPGGPTRTDGGWIDARIITAYTRLHEMGFAQSVEVWQGDELVGGLYGVALRGLFAGESMFSSVRDASKVALVHLVALLRKGGFALLDVQFQTDHLRQFGAIEVSRASYRQRLGAALQIHARFPTAPVADPLETVRETQR